MEMPSIADSEPFSRILPTAEVPGETLDLSVLMDLNVNVAYTLSDLAKRRFISYTYHDTLVDHKQAILTTIIVEHCIAATIQVRINAVLYWYQYTSNLFRTMTVCEKLKPHQTSLDGPVRMNNNCKSLPSLLLFHQK